MQVRTAFSTCLRISHRQPGTTFRMYSRCQTRVVSLVGRRTELLAHQLLQDKAIAVDAKWMIRSLVPSPCVHQASQNDHHHRASVSEVSKVKNAPTDASVHGFVRRIYGFPTLSRNSKNVAAAFLNCHFPSPCCDFKTGASSPSEFPMSSTYGSADTSPITT